jgi:hypothetical protein
VPVTLSLGRLPNAPKPCLPRHQRYGTRLHRPDRSHSYRYYARSLARPDGKRSAVQPFRRYYPGRPASHQMVIISSHELLLHARQGYCGAPDRELSVLARSGAML